MRIFLQAPVTEDRPPRYYQLFIQEDLLGGWSLVRQWGYQGGQVTVQREYHECREDAELAMTRYRDTQLKRGFRVVFAQGEEAPR
ncbi:MAG: WGR domain-containing protein [Chromatiales bacterium]|nr:WGR domain-containing protein [Gammaproteobacteria bacterium]MBW6475869.1 WGR domain-containing protein [Chromatiales bacterium]